MLNTERLWGGHAANPASTIMGLGASLLFLLTALPLQAAVAVISVWSDVNFVDPSA